MRKLLGTFFNLLTVLFILLLVAAGALLFVVDPDRYRQSLEQFVLTESGLQLEIAGDMSLMLRPYVGMRISDVRIRDSQQPRELGSVSLLAVKVDPWRLLRGQLLLQELGAESVHINWYTDSEGNNSWEQIFREQAALPSSEDPGAAIQNVVALVTVAESSIDFQDHQRGTHFTVRNLEFTGRESNTVEAGFRIRAEFDWSDESGSPPRRLVISSLNRANLNSGDLSVDELQVTYTPVQLQGDMEIRDLFSNTSWSGKLVSNTFPLTDLLINLGVLEIRQAPITTSPEPRSDSDATTVQVTFQGDARQLRIPSATVTLGNMTADADAVIRYSNGLSPNNIT
ncbi:MAG: AsmA family protein, partial [Pseudohongiellaceae bacterium]